MYKTIVKPTLVLTVIAVAISALLALTYNLTGVGEASAGIAQDKLDEYAQVVLPGASFKQADLLAETAVRSTSRQRVITEKIAWTCLSPLTKMARLRVFIRFLRRKLPVLAQRLQRQII